MDKQELFKIKLLVATPETQVCILCSTHEQVKHAGFLIGEALPATTIRARGNFYLINGSSVFITSDPDSLRGRLFHKILVEDSGAYPCDVLDSVLSRLLIQR